MDNSKAPVVNVNAAVERMGDKDIYIEISQFFAGHLPESVDAVGKALDTGEIAEAARLIHSMKSNCATVGADDLKERCYALEQTCRAGDLGASRRIFADLKEDLNALVPVLLAMH